MFFHYSHTHIYLCREEAIRKKVEERKRLEKEKKMFAVRLEGTVTAVKPPAGTLVPGPLENEAKVQLNTTASTLVGGATSPASVLYTSPADAAEDLPRAIGQQIKAASDACASAMRLQAMTGAGPLEVMEESELQHWLALSAARATVKGITAGQAALTKLQKSNGKPSEERFEARTEYGVLPKEHAKRTDAVIHRVIGSIEAGAAPSDIHAALEDLLETDNAIFYSGFTDLPKDLAAAPKFLGGAFTLAYLLNVMLNDRPAKVSDAPAWFESAAALVRQELKEMVAGAAPDALRLPDSIVTFTLGVNHPVALELASLADKNESPLTKQARQEKQRRYQTELAEKLLEEEWPDEEEMRAARMADRNAKTPVPERVWALRNVAGTLAMGGPGERSRARQLLEQAVILKQQFAGAPDHPGSYFR